MNWRHYLSPLVAIYAVASFLLGTAFAQSGQGEADWALVFVFAFVGGLVLFAYIASRLMKPSRTHSDDARIIPMPVDYTRR